MRCTQFIWIFLIGCLMPLTAHAQKGLLDKANRQYELHNFKEALVSYQRYIKNNRNDVNAKGKLADCFRHVGRYQDALRWYKEIEFAGKDFPELTFQHALTLKSMGKYEEARKLFLVYAKSQPTEGMHFAESCTLALNKLNSTSTYTVTNSSISSDAADFGPTFFKNGVIYGSARIDYSVSSKRRDDLNQLFISNYDFSGNLSKPALFHERFNGFNEGPLAYSPNGRWVAFTKNNYVDGVRQIPSAGLNLNIFIAEVLENGEWQKEKFFPFNGSNFSTGFPSFSPDGNYLYFASNRPDGFGGFDIFVSQRLGDDNWSTPENLGPNVNTQGNEITPFFGGQDLFFSSDWHQGMGGFDVFRASRTGNYWDKIYNLDTQINSSKDDFGFIYNYNNNVGYLVSNRAGGKGKEDIYKVSKGAYDPSYSGNGTTGGISGGTMPQRPSNGNNPQQPQQGGSGGTYPTSSARTLEIVVLDEFSMRPIPNAEIDFTLCGQGRFYTGANGRYMLNIPAGLNCEILIRQRGYISGLLRVSGNSLNGVQSQQVLLRNGNVSVPNRPPVTPTTPPVTQPTYTNNNLVLGRIYDSGGNTGISDVEIKAVSQSTSTMLETSTAVTGEYNLRLRPNTTYVITYSKSGYKSISRNVTVGSIVDAQLLGSFPLQYTGGNSTPVVNTTNANTTNVEVAKGSGIAIGGTGLAGYSVQVAAFRSTDNVNFEKYKTLGTYGNVYNRYENDRTKIRIGVFASRAEAQAAVAKIKRQGFKDAFVTSELKEGLGEGIMLGSDNSSIAVPTSTPTSQSPTTTSGSVYKVRLASYRNPKFFKASKVTGLGTLEQRSKGPWTIMLLSGYPSLSEAIFAKNNAIQAGFRQAHVVLDNGVELEKVKF